MAITILNAGVIYYIVAAAATLIGGIIYNRYQPEDSHLPSEQLILGAIVAPVIVPPVAIGYVITLLSPYRKDTRGR